MHWLFYLFTLLFSSQMQGACLSRNFFMQNRPVGRSGSYKSQRWKTLMSEADGSYYSNVLKQAASLSVSQQDE